MLCTSRPHRARQLPRNSSLSPSYLGTKPQPLWLLTQLPQSRVLQTKLTPISAAPLIGTLSTKQPQPPPCLCALQHHSLYPQRPSCHPNRALGRAVPLVRLLASLAPSGEQHLQERWKEASLLNHTSLQKPSGVCQERAPALLLSTHTRRR